MNLGIIKKMANRFEWWLAVYGSFGALIILLPKIIFGNGITTFLFTVVVAAGVSLVLLVVVFQRIRHRSLSVLAMLAVFCVALWLFFKASYDMHTTFRWLFESKSYRAQVLSQPAVGNGELKHVEWEGWGFAGAGDTVVYLVFDPDDSLDKAAQSDSPGKFSGIPCRVLRVRRLKKHWYSVLFYTDTDWDHCT